MSGVRRRRRGGNKVITYLLHTFSNGVSNTSPGNADTGQAPSVLAGTFGIDASGYLYQVSATTDSVVLWDAGVSDGTFTIDVIAIATTSALWRCYPRSVSLTDRMQFVAIDANTWQLYKFVAGTPTLIGNWAVAPAVGTLTFSLNGSNWTIKQNATTLGSFSETANQSNTKFGYGNDGVNVCRADNIKVTS